MAKNKEADVQYIAGMGESPEDRANGADMAKQYREAGEEQARLNLEAAEARREAERQRPLVTLGTAEAIAMGVRAGESPTPGERPEGWEFVSEDVAKVAGVVGKLAETTAESNEKVAAAQAEAREAQREAVAEAELGPTDDGPTVAAPDDPRTRNKSDK